MERDTTIKAPFHLGKRVLDETDESWASHSANGQQVAYTCSHCHCKNKVYLGLYQTGYLVDQLFRTNTFITRAELIKNEAVRINSASDSKYLGELSLWRVPALYEQAACECCGQPFIVFFGYGEIQPGREVVQISGIWEVKPITGTNEQTQAEPARYMQFEELLSIADACQIASAVVYGMNRIKDLLAFLTAGNTLYIYHFNNLPGSFKQIDTVEQFAQVMQSIDNALDLKNKKELAKYFLP